MPRVRGSVRGRPTGCGKGRDMDDRVPTASVPVKGRGRRGNRCISSESSTSSGHEEVFGGPLPLQAMTDAMRDVARALCDKIPAPMLHSPRRETSPDPIEPRFRRYMKDLRGSIHLLSWVDLTLGL